MDDSIKNNMRQAILIFVSIAIHSVLMAQTQSSIDLSIGLGSAYRDVGSLEDVISVKPIGTSGEAQKRGLSHNLELSYSKSISKSTALITGLNYATYNMDPSKFEDLRWPNDHDGNGGFSPNPNSQNEIRFSSSNTFLGVPILFRYEVSEEVISPFIEVGPSINMLTSITYPEAYSTGSVVNSQMERYKSFFLLGRISGGANFKLNDNFQLFGALSYVQEISNFHSKAINEKLVNYRFNIGLRKLICGTKSESKL